eukprot:CAMPEP_0113945844 /NCGR_PEP_ID=MMETSP1339-20121228/52341_1 /TAXON_ID=94617 /ORGANISM="Fibrocapsa japonica" /LENGTH=107 /DNA_ID=CAMNT_0000951657 /DNA_START=161 /DNA_END=484 /DNA_ORIENTATION=- /assembly_acc=CAM_ASM_000762
MSQQQHRRINLRRVLEIKDTVYRSSIYQSGVRCICVRVGISPQNLSSSRHGTIFAGGDDNSDEETPLYIRPVVTTGEDDMEEIREMEAWLEVLRRAAIQFQYGVEVY